MKISQLQALAAVADHGNFTEAALTLNISQSAVSHAIAGLEEELGVPLLLRGRQGATPTPVGERVLLHARKLLRLLEDIVHETTLEKGLLGGRLRIASFRSAATHLLPPVIARFRQQFPNIAVTIMEVDDYSDVEQRLREGRADLGMTYLPAPEEFDSWEIRRDDYVMLVRDCDAPEPSSLTWEALANYSFIVSTSECCTAQRVFEHCAAAGHSLNVAYQVREDSTIVSMVAQGLGAAIMPRLAAEPLPKDIRVCALPDRLERVIGAAILTNALHVPAVFAFLDALRGTGRFAEPRRTAVKSPPPAEKLGALG